MKIYIIKMSNLSKSDHETIVNNTNRTSNKLDWNINRNNTNIIIYVLTCLIPSPAGVYVGFWRALHAEGATNTYHTIQLPWKLVVGVRSFPWFPQLPESHHCYFYPLKAITATPGRPLACLTPLCHQKVSWVVYFSHVLMCVCTQNTCFYPYRLDANRWRSDQARTQSDTWHATWHPRWCKPRKSCSDPQKQVRTAKKRV